MAMTIERQKEQLRKKQVARKRAARRLRENGHAQRKTNNRTMAYVLILAVIGLIALVVTVLIIDQQRADANFAQLQQNIVATQEADGYESRVYEYCEDHLIALYDDPNAVQNHREGYGACVNRYFDTGLEPPNEAPNY